MGDSSQQAALAVYDFDEENDSIEDTSGKYNSRFEPPTAATLQNPSSGDDQMEEEEEEEEESNTKYSCLQAFQSGSQTEKTDVSGGLCIELHEGDGNQRTYATESPETNLASSDERTEFDGTMAMPSYNEHSHAYSIQPVDIMTKAQSIMGVSLLTTSNGGEQFFEFQSHGVVADSEQGSWSSSPESSSTTNSDDPGYLEHPANYGPYTAFDEMVDNNGPVVLYPEFVICNKAEYLEPQIIFSSDFFKIEYVESDACSDGTKIAMECGISEIVSISCRWTGSLGSGLVRLVVRAVDEVANNNVINIEFPVSDGHWVKKQQKIWNLASRYQEIWNTLPPDGFISESFSFEPSLSFPKQYFTRNLEPFEEVVYPKGDPDAVSINKRDVDMLLPETFVNDTLIDFYIKYLSDRIDLSEKQRHHFFNSFFFRKLADLDKDPGKAPEGRAAFLRVRKWTRKVNIFEKDFIFIPVNYNLHWSLVVICYPGEVVNYDHAKEVLPCILHMDSLKGSHSGLKDIVQSYLCEEWKERHPESSADDSAKFSNLRFFSLELPQQDNLYDCGLFLLHYVELFLADAPTTFNTLKLADFSSFLSDSWFPPAEASLKRSLIRKLIYDLLDEPFKKVPSSTCVNGYHRGGSHINDIIEQELGVDFLPLQCRTGEIDGSLCVVDDVPETKELSTSLCLDASDEKTELISQCILENGAVSVVPLENLSHPRVQVLEDHMDKSVSLDALSRDGESTSPGANSNGQPCSTSCTPCTLKDADAGVFETLGSNVEEKDNHEDALLEYLDSQKVASQTDETGNPDVMNENCCLLPQNSALSSGEKLNATEDGSPGNNTVKSEEGRSNVSQDICSVRADDASRDDVEGAEKIRHVGDGECCGLPILIELAGRNADCMEIGCANGDSAAAPNCPDVGDTNMKEDEDVTCDQKASSKDNRIPNSTCQVEDTVSAAPDCPDVGDTNLLDDGGVASEHKASTKCKLLLLPNSTSDTVSTATDLPGVGDTTMVEYEDGNCPDVGDKTTVEAEDVASEQTSSSECKRPLPDSTSQDKDAVYFDDECPLDKDVKAPGTKQEQQRYKRRKVIARERS